MHPPRDPWLQDQIERYRAGNAASAAMYQQAASLLSARELLAAGTTGRHRQLLSPGRWLRRAFGARRRRGKRASHQQSLRAWLHHRPLRPT